MAKSPRRSFPNPPSQARAVVLRGHPLADSFNSALADAWIDGARAEGAHVEVFDVHALTFDPVLHFANRQDEPLEPDLRRVQAAIGAAAHLTVAFPVWWASTPAKLKGLFDRVFQTGWAYAAGDGMLPDKGLLGRTGRLLVTMDAPTLYDRIAYGGSAIRQVRNGTLHFSGIKPTRVSAFGGIESTTSENRTRMLARARRDGAKDGAALRKRFGAPHKLPTAAEVAETPPASAIA